MKTSNLRQSEDQKDIFDVSSSESVISDQEQSSPTLNYKEISKHEKDKITNLSNDEKFINPNVQPISFSSFIENNEDFEDKRVYEEEEDESENDQYDFPKGHPAYVPSNNNYYIHDNREANGFEYDNDFSNDYKNETPLNEDETKDKENTKFSREKIKRQENGLYSDEIENESYKLWTENEADLVNQWSHDFYYALVNNSQKPETSDSKYKPLNRQFRRNNNNSRKNRENQIINRQENSNLDKPPTYHSNYRNKGNFHRKFQKEKNDQKNIEKIPSRQSRNPQNRRKKDGDLYKDNLVDTNQNNVIVNENDNNNTNNNNHTDNNININKVQDIKYFTNDTVKENKHNSNNFRGNNHVQRPFYRHRNYYHNNYSNNYNRNNNDKNSTKYYNDDNSQQHPSYPDHNFNNQYRENTHAKKYYGRRRWNSYRNN